MPAYAKYTLAHVYVIHWFAVDAEYGKNFLISMFYNIVQHWIWGESWKSVTGAQNLEICRLKNSEIRSIFAILVCHQNQCPWFFWLTL